MFTSISEKPIASFLRTENDLIEDITRLSPIEKKLQLEELFKTHHYQIFRLCLQVTKDVEIAENLTIEVFIRMFREFDNLDRNITHKDSLRKIAVSHLIDYKRQTQPPAKVRLL